MAILGRAHHDIYPFIDPSKGLMDSARGKSVLVTGGSQGIGKAIALHFALAGASTVTITGRNAKSLQDSVVDIQSQVPDCTVHAIPADVTVPESVQSLFDQLPGPLDVLVNNAGTAAGQSPLADSDLDTWWSDMEVSVKGCFLCSRAYLRALGAEGNPGVILNVSSSVSTTTNAGLSSYATAKSAVNRLTEFLHLEYSGQGVRSIAFHPGGILDTGMGQSAPSYFKPYLYDTVNLAAGTAVYLSTPRADFLSGRFVFSNYDMEQLEQLKEQILREDLLKTRVVFGDILGSAVIPPQ